MLSKIRIDGVWHDVPDGKWELRYLSVCSGIEAATVAWEPLGFSPVAFSEIEKFPAAVLAHHYPTVPNLGDMAQIKGEDYNGIVDILVGGTPCQAFSVAGARKGLADDRGNLTLVFAGLADAIQPGFVVWENVPGVLSDKTNAFGCFLGLLAGEDDALQPPGGKWTDAGFVLGPERTIAWRVLDAQYFGLAQRRRRVFLVACPRGGADPREILFERESVRRDSAPSREAGKGITHDVAPSLGASGRGVERAGETRGQDPVVAVVQAIHENQRGEITTNDVVPLLEVGARTGNSTTNIRAGIGIGNSQDPMYTLQSGKQHGVGVASRVRRLTPVECERLQGFPDGYTAIPWRGKPADQCPDGPRYKALGNSMAVPCMAWIGKRIKTVAAQNVDATLAKYPEK